MTGERLCGLAMPHSHRNMAVNRANILRRYDASGHRKIGRCFYGQLRQAQILIPLTITKKTLIFNIYPSPVHENAYIEFNKLIDYKMSSSYQSFYFH